LQLLNEHEKIGSRVWARPKRVAFLVDDAFTSRDINTIVAYCFKHLGGRWNAIAPITSNSIAPAWEKFLVAIDADVLYSFVELSDSLKESLNKRLRPSRIIEANALHHHKDGWRLSEEEIGGIQLADVDLPYQPTAFSRFTVPQITIADFDQRDDDAFNFCFRNFGGYSEREWNAFNLSAKDVTLLPAAIAEPEVFLASVLPSYGRHFPIYFSTVGYGYSHFGANLRDQAQEFEIMVGDSIHDFIYAWNRGITSLYSGRRRAIWLPASALQKEAVAGLVAQYIRESLPDSSADTTCRILSYSLTEAELAPFSASILPKLGRPTTHAQLTKDAACDMHGVTLAGCPDKSQRYEFAQSDTLFNAPLPESFNEKRLGQQGWVVEVELEKPGSGENNLFRQNTWHLPARYLVDKKFFERQTMSRVTLRGHLAIEVKADRRNIPIKIPTVKDLCDVLIVEQNITGSGDQMKVTSGHFRRIGISSDGQFFWNILKLFGGLKNANKLLDDEGWREVLMFLVGEMQDLDSIDALLTEFKKDNKQGKTARKLAQALIDKPEKLLYIHHGKILEILKKAGSVIGDQESDFVTNRLHSLLSRNILFQGTASRCYHCNLKRWYRVDELKAQMTCQGCGADYALQPLNSLSFRLNELVVNGFKRSGLLPVFQALFLLHRESRNHLLFLPQQDLFDWTEGKDKQVTDLDLIGILDGKYFLGEVKSSERGLLSVDIDQLLQIALELRPNFILIAAPAAGFTSKVKKHYEPLLKGLADKDIAVESMRLEWTKTSLPWDFVKPPGSNSE